MVRIEVTQNSIMANCQNFAKRTINLQPFYYIPAVKHANIITQLCQKDAFISQLGLFCLAISHNNQFFYTSNDPYLSAAYINTGLYRADNFFHQALQSNQDVLLANQLDNNDDMRRLVVEVLSQNFNLFNCYCLIRRCEDCVVIIAIAMHENITDLKQFHQKTFSPLQNFSTIYIDQFLELYLENLPSLRYTRFAQDKAFRDNVINNSYQSTPRLSISNRETQCLYWLSLGKTAQETAILMGISEHTVVEHKKKIMQKLNVSNIVHAVREAMLLKLI